MNIVRRLCGKLCGKLPGRSGLIGFFVCCVLPCKSLVRKKAAADQEKDKVELPSAGTRQVLLLGLEGAGKSCFLWLSEHPTMDKLQDASLTPSAGVVRLT